MRSNVKLRPRHVGKTKPKNNESRLLTIECGAFIISIDALHFLVLRISNRGEYQDASRNQVHARRKSRIEKED